jgi:hypothetical protein
MKLQVCGEDEISTLPSQEFNMFCDNGSDSNKNACTILKVSPCMEIKCSVSKTSYQILNIILKSL